jgi:uncharacterized membrane protein YccC
VLGIDHALLDRRRALAAATMGRLRPLTRSSIEFAAKAGLATGLSIWLGDAIGLQDSYWAGISAVVATAGTLGASLGAAISRISATIVGLVVGLAAFALPLSGPILEGATVFVALIVLAVLSLDAGARLGAATTLIVTAIPGSNAVGDALARGANVPLGCAVAVGVGVLLLPQRAAERLRASLRASIEQAGELVRSAISAYAGAPAEDDLDARLQRLAADRSAHQSALHDAAREPGERGERLLALRRDVAQVEALVEPVALLVAVVREADDDTAPSLVKGELQQLADTFAAAARALASCGSADTQEETLQRLSGALAAVDAAFAAARERRATAEFSTEEVARLLSVVRALHAATATLLRVPGRAPPVTAA